jgi:hypothetical protein
MSTSDSVQRNTLTYLRLAAECRNLAAVVPLPLLKAQFLRTAKMWEKLANRAPGPTTLH